MTEKVISFSVSKAEVEQLFYDLYNTAKNESANDKEFNLLFRQNEALAFYHYVVVTNYLKNTDNDFFCKQANELQAYIINRIFNKL